MKTIRELQQKYFSAPYLDIIFAHSLNTPREFLYTHPECQLSIWQYLKLRYFLWQRKRGVPLAYITGHKEFFGLNFFVNRHVLIPRPETELLVENAIEEIRNATRLPFYSPTVLIDIGAGSGCIPIAIKKILNHENTKVIAIDISRPALRVAKRNARTHDVNIIFLHGNLLEPILNHYELLAKNYELIITANLPYLTQAQFDTEKSIQREPSLALVAGPTGLELYEKLLKQIKLLLEIGHWKLGIFLEIDPSQSQSITPLIKKYLPAANVEIKKDLANRNRLAVIRVN